MPEHRDDPSNNPPADAGLFFSSFGAIDESDDPPVAPTPETAFPAAPGFTDIGFDFEPDDDSFVGFEQPPASPPAPRPAPQQASEPPRTPAQDDESDLLSAADGAPQVMDLDATTIDTRSSDRSDLPTAERGAPRAEMDPDKTTIERTPLHEYPHSAGDSATAEFDTLAELQRRAEAAEHGRQPLPPAPDDLWDDEFVVPPAAQLGRDAMVDSLFDDSFGELDGSHLSSAGANGGGDLPSEDASGPFPPDVDFMGGDVLPPGFSDPGSPERLGQALAEDDGPSDILGSLPLTEGAFEDDLDSLFDDLDAVLPPPDRPADTAEAPSLSTGRPPPALERGSGAYAAGQMLADDEAEESGWLRVGPVPSDPEEDAGWSVVHNPPGSFASDSEPGMVRSQDLGDEELPMDMLDDFAAAGKGGDGPSSGRRGAALSATAFHDEAGIDSFFETDSPEAAELNERPAGADGDMDFPEALASDAVPIPGASISGGSDASFTGGQALPDVPEPPEAQPRGDALSADESLADLFVGAIPEGDLGDGEEVAPRVVNFQDDLTLPADDDLPIHSLAEEEPEPAEEDEADGLEEDAIDDLFANMPAEAEDADDSAGYDDAPLPVGGVPESAATIPDIAIDTDLGRDMPEDDLMREGRAGGEENPDTLALLEAGLAGGLEDPEEEAEPGGEGLDVDADSVDDLFLAATVQSEEFGDELADALLPESAGEADPSADESAELFTDMAGVDLGAMDGELGAAGGLTGLFDGAELGGEMLGEGAGAAEEEPEAVPLSAGGKLAMVGLFSLFTAKQLAARGLRAVDRLVDIRNNWGLYIDLVALTIMTISAAVIVAAVLHR